MEDSFNSSYTGIRYDLLKYVKGRNNLVLDVGCANGVNGRYLIENHFAEEVFGVEYHEGMSEEAEKNITKLFQGDLNQENFRKKIVYNSPLFDYIIFGDILEHLIHPQLVLSDLSKLLKPGGIVILSLPNIGHIELFIQVYIRGTWPLNSRGIFDETHLRWFTRKDAWKLLENSDLKILKYERKFRSRDNLNSTFRWYHKILKRLNKDWLTFQHILIGTNG